MSTYLSINLAARPGAGPVTRDLFEVVRKVVPTAGPGQILVKQTHMSLDPAMVMWMTPDPDSYLPPVALGEVMRATGVGTVVESNHPDYASGDEVRGLMGWTEYLVSDGRGLSKVPPGLDAETVLALFGIPGLTATKGLYDFGKPKSGETIVVSGAAGSVGSLVGQLAKADGLRVIGVAGSEEKCNWICNELGFDGAINYKTDDIAARLDELAPGGVDIFFENTGGPIQQHVFDRMNAQGRIVVCGLIAEYAGGKPSPGPNWLPLVKKRIAVRGFTVTDHLKEVPALIEKLTPYVVAGQIKFRTHTLEGLESAIDGLNLFATGGNRGKLIVKL